ncbi:HD domain-containing protein [Fontibacillus sp. BL9]|uniref:HD domain-containing protein n=1 Tax=Fontibacillus sp. BL9 TaxID=3389971 RepID=UPI00397981AA
MNNHYIIEAAETFVKKELEFEPSGHDWWHIERVRNLAVAIAKREQADPLVCELSALLHDIADEKLNDSKESGLEKVSSWLMDHGADQELKDHVMLIISTMSYNGGKNPPMDTIEGKVVQDADRLDAMGAIGIARTFIYSGATGRPMHQPGKDFSGVDYRSSEKSAIYHFYEKLLKLKTLLNTEYARVLAEERHDFMESYLNQFYKEWDLKE